MASVEQPGLWRRTFLRQHRLLGRGCFAVQKGQYSLNDRRVLNADSDLDLTTAPLARLDIDPDAAQLNTRLSHCIQVIATWRSAGVLSIQVSPVGWRPLPRLAHITLTRSNIRLMDSGNDRKEQRNER